MSIHAGWPTYVGVYVTVCILLYMLFAEVAFKLSFEYFHTLSRYSYLVGGFHILEVLTAKTPLCDFRLNLLSFSLKLCPLVLV